MLHCLVALGSKPQRNQKEKRDIKKTKAMIDNSPAVIMEAWPNSLEV